MKLVASGTTINAAEVGDLGEAIKSVPACGGAVYIPAGTYEIDRTVEAELAEKRHIHIYGDGRATVIRYTATDGSPLLKLAGVRNSWWPDLKITIRDLTLVGNYDCGDAFHLLWPNDCLIDACAFHGFGGVAVYIGPHATNVTVRDCWMRDCKRALHAENLHHLTLHGIQTRSRKGGQTQAEHVYIGRHCREVRIVNNHLSYGHAEGIILDGTAQHVVANNTIEGFPEGIRVLDCRDLVINGNYIRTDVGVLMEGDNRGIAVSNNIFTSNSVGAVVIRDAYDSGAHVVSGNIIRQSLHELGQRGIDLGDAHGCVVANNVLEDLTDGSAIDGAVDLSCHEIHGNSVTNSANRVILRDRFFGPVEANPQSEYFPLFGYLKEVDPSRRRLTLTFEQVEKALGTTLPTAAAEQTEWWTNDLTKPQARAWMAAGWLVTIRKRIEGRIVFVRAGS
jgi:hypothetical protein